MQIDPYAPCPCGSGKKIKFCCSKDLLHELDKITRTLSGEQYVSALDQTAKLIAEQGPRAALLAIQAEIFLVINQIPDAEKTVGKLLEVMPHSSVGLAVRAVTDTMNGRLNDAIDHLQQSIENVDTMVHSSTALAMLVVARALVQAGRFVAARGHFLMRAGMSGGEDQEAVQALLEINRIERLPTMLKQDFQFAECPRGVPWHGEFEAAMKSARRGAWLAACENLESLDQKVPGQAAVLRNIAILRGWLGNNEAACTAWRTYIALPGVPEEDAVDAEAFCQILGRGDTFELIDSLKLTYPITDIDRLLEILQSDKRIDQPPVDPATLVEDGQVPPRAFFKLLDRPLPPTHVGIAYGEIPRVIGDILVFGKQTDRPARLEFEVERTARFDDVKEKLLVLVGGHIGPPEPEQLQGQVSRMQLELNPEVRFPPDITAARLIELINDQRRHVYLDVWPEIPRGIYDGKSAREAAHDPALRVRVMAAILNLELATEEQSSSDRFDFDVLRSTLGLPPRGTFDAHGTEILSLPVSRLARVDCSKLSDEELVTLCRLGALKVLQEATRNSAREAVSRPSMAELLDLSEFYQLLVAFSNDPEQALKDIDSGRKIAVAKGRSPATWYLMELQLRLTLQEADECNRLIRLLSTRHAREPGVSEGLYKILVRFGVISPDGQVLEQPPPERSRENAPAAASGAPGLWTPDSPAPRKEESKLWLPGL